MPGRKLLTDADWIPTHFGPSDLEMIRRRAILHETIDRFENGKLITHYQKLAQQNLVNWSAARKPPPASQHVLVKQGD